MMNQELRQLCELFSKNVDTAIKQLPWEHREIQYLCAFQYAIKNQMLEGERIKEGKRVIKDQTKLFSDFKSTGFTSMATNVSLYSNPEESFKKVQNIYHDLKREGFKSSVYLAFAAFTLADQVPNDKLVDTMQRALRIYKEMKENHSFLTSRDDYGYAIMLSISELPENQLLRSAENCYSLLKGSFFSRDSIQSLSHILSLSFESDAVKTNRVLEIYDQLKNKKCKPGTSFELASLGILAMLDLEMEQIVEEVVEVNDYLKEQDKFNANRATRVMIACMLVGYAHMSADQNYLAKDIMSGAMIGMVRVRTDSRRGSRS